VEIQSEDGRMKVAFIGLGNMGSGIAQRILQHGHDLTVWNRTNSKAEPLVAQGAQGAKTARDAVSRADVVITSLMDDKSVIGIVKAEDGILVGMKSGAIHACVTTISPACADELELLHREHGSFYVSAPVVGRPDAAASGQLASFLGGEIEATKTLTSVCEAYSKSVVSVSTRPRMANVMKLAINFNVVSTIELISETYIFAEKCGLPTEHLRDFYQELWYAHPAAKMYAEKLRKCDFAGRGGFVMSGGLKDVRLMLSTAAEARTRLEIGELVERHLSMGVDAGMGEQDWSSFHELARKNAGLT
jgi:3-hydroxyisobutyrate dehydrogenase-like beta-hydroxyacid dehydrogenase